jgi:hypothetical protein
MKVFLSMEMGMVYLKMVGLEHGRMESGRMALLKEFGRVE